MEVPDVQLHIYGGEQAGYEDYATRIRNRLLVPSLRNTVTLKGHVQHPYRNWTGAAVYVQASRRENYPVSILEAMAAGLPVVATDVGAVSEIVEHDKTGIVVPPDDPRAMAGAISRLLGNPSLAANMAVAGRRRVVDHFAPSAMAQRMLSVYGELPKRRR
jgi:glycosyltransferase involved in cell wall biosynthesis